MHLHIDFETPEKDDKNQDGGDDRPDYFQFGVVGDIGGEGGIGLPAVPVLKKMMPNTTMARKTNEAYTRKLNRVSNSPEKVDLPGGRKKVPVESIV
jgi:hypothetical protein